MDEKTCRRCKASKPLESFPSGKSLCKTCYNMDQVVWRLNNPGKVSTYVKRWQHANPDKARSCAKNWHSKNPEYNKNYLNSRVVSRYFRKIERLFGLTQDQYNQMLARQDFQCAICGFEDVVLHVDHHHGTNVVRGLLCGTCNSGIGLLKDDPKVLTQASNYVSAHM